MTSIDLERLAALEQAATPGPWALDGPEPCYTVRSENVSWIAECEEAPEDAALIVAARNALPELIAEIRSLRQEVGR